jgi:predicted DNA-binding transcriptional regulator YafY
MRFNELQRCIGTITYKTLSNTLKEMEAIIMILMKRKTVVAAELFEAFEVSLRTIYQDIDTLGKAGIPIVSLPDPEAA